ncbi:MAG: type I 3-dehydroquinate dehydratase [Bacteroidales bacterium]
MICISIPEKHRGKAISIANISEMAEIRIDMAGFSAKDVAFVFSKSESNLIATCRPEFVSDKERIILLQTAIENGAAYVDIEIDATDEVKQALIPFAQSHTCQVIISYHNYESTPSVEELEVLIKQGFDEKADIVKIATTAQTVQDSARLLSLYQTERPLVALAMGEEGKITRVANIALGSPFTFASLSSETITAPGQLTVDEMKPFLKI